MENRNPIDEVNESFNISQDQSKQIKIPLSYVIIFVVILVCLSVGFFVGTIYNKSQEIESDIPDEAEFEMYVEQIIEEKTAQKNVEKEIEEENIVDEQFEDIESSTEEDYKEYSGKLEGSDYESEKFKEQKQNIEIEKIYKGNNNSFIISLKNNNEEIISDIDVEYVFYDKDGLEYSSGFDYIQTLKANSNYYLLIDNAPDDYSKITYTLTKENFDEYKYYYDEITYNAEVHQTNTDYLIISGKNNADTWVDFVTFSVIYYDANNNPVYISTAEEYEIEPNEEFMISHKLELRKDEYSRFEVVLSDAYTYLY